MFCLWLFCCIVGSFLQPTWDLCRFFRIWALQLVIYPIQRCAWAAVANLIVASNFEQTKTIKTSSSYWVTYPKLNSKKVANYVSRDVAKHLHLSICISREAVVTSYMPYWITTLDFIPVMGSGVGVHTEVPSWNQVESPRQQDKHFDRNLILPPFLPHHRGICNDLHLALQGCSSWPS